MRPEPDARRTAAALKAAGHDVLCSPILTVSAIAGATIPPGPWDAVIMTSANAARAIADHAGRDELLSCPVFVVGTRTAEVARSVGFSDVRSHGKDVVQLSRGMARLFHERNARCLYLAGADRAADLETDLMRDGIVVTTVVVYRALLADVFSDGVRQALASRTLDGALHYSPRSARAFLAAAHASGLESDARAVIHYCLSEAVAEPLRMATMPRIRIAEHPDEPSLFRLLEAGS